MPITVIAGRRIHSTSWRPALFPLVSQGRDQTRSGMRFSFPVFIADVIYDLVQIDSMAVFESEIKIQKRGKSSLGRIFPGYEVVLSILSTNWQHGPGLEISLIN